MDDRVKDDLKLRLLQDFTTYSLPPLLRYEDRASMAHSLEARLPFLDQELVEYILALPADAIIEHGWNRRVLREGLKDVLPPVVYKRRKKVGFTTPEFRWYRRERAVLNGLLRSPSFTGRKYWDGPAVADAFRRACDGDVEESMFFWRAINAEVWMRIYFDDDATALDDHSYRAGFVERGDRVVGARERGGGSAARVAKPNPGNHLFLQVGDDVCARIPLRSRVITPADDVVDAILEAIDHADGIEVDDGDLLLVSEKALSISQGNALPVADIRTSRAARLLSRFVSRTPVGVGLGHPATMQLAIDEVGLPRILLAAFAGAVTRPVRDARRLLSRRRWPGERDRRTVVGATCRRTTPGRARHRPTAKARSAGSRAASRRAPATRSRSRSSTPTTSPPRCSPPPPVSTPRPCVASSSTTRWASRPSRRRSVWFARLPSSTSFTPRKRVEVDVSAIRANTSALVQHVGSGVQVMAMVKSNGYGHGLQLAAEAAIEGGATWLGVASSAEAFDVSTFRLPVLIVGRCDPGSHDALIDAGIETTVYDDEGVDTTAGAAARVGRRARVHVKVDTGMGRLGVNPDGLTEFLRTLAKYSADVEIAGVFTQLRRLRRARPRLHRTTARLLRGRGRRGARRGARRARALLEQRRHAPSATHAPRPRPSGHRPLRVRAGHRSPASSTSGWR